VLFLIVYAASSKAPKYAINSEYQVLREDAAHCCRQRLIAIRWETSTKASKIRKGDGLVTGHKNPIESEFGY
jgi:hypothetical protein